MPLLLLAVPALVGTQAPAPAPKAVDRVQDLFEAIPEAFIDGKRGAMPGLVAKAKAGWEQARPELLKALGEAEAAAIDRQVGAMVKMSPREQAVGALGVSTALSRLQGKSRQQDLLNADRTVMLAWCLVDSGQFNPLPGVAEAFRPVIDGDNGHHGLAVMAVRDALKRLQESQQKNQAAGAKKALKDLLKLVDVFEKP
ncbi:MAG: hypothetical protein HXX12_08385 [Geothrix sp.]|uniref:hypothetical protein n=1 Tax=Geothrix sp. TaxID=1962974 RepID=UPI0017DE7DF4|nr:hypothetical protein [Geothrix sp.]NWJ40975.1 hypothetical protein [Geothrix sp.]WIL21028.1 MAG: hypothetical protein QOZ81_000272 [Geothrix sp.]